jgi:hypothetical protein
MVIGQSQGTNKLALTNKTGETVMRQGQVFYVANDSTARNCCSSRQRI